MFRKILVANRGEIALRIIRACHEEGLEAVAVYSSVDRASPHVRAADLAVPIGPPAPSESYLSIDRLLEAGAALEQRLPGDVTVLMLAAALGLPDLCARLLMAGANVQAQDAQGLTALHCATLFGFTARERPRLCR